MDSVISNTNINEANNLRDDFELYFLKVRYT